MPLRHVIVEGPDGAGKDTLIEFLTSHSMLQLHARASTSEGGPLADITQWFKEDLHTIEQQPPSVYNRHPLISEPIYAPLVRNVAPQGMYASPRWVRDGLDAMARYALMVWCMPPCSEVMKNVLNGPKQMPGVITNIMQLYGAYHRGMTHGWPGKFVAYDYTQHQPMAVMTRVRMALGGLI